MTASAIVARPDSEAERVLSLGAREVLHDAQDEEHVDVE